MKFHVFPKLFDCKTPFSENTSDAVLWEPLIRSNPLIVQVGKLKSTEGNFLKFMSMHLLADPKKPQFYWLDMYEGLVFGPKWDFSLSCSFVYLSLPQTPLSFMTVNEYTQKGNSNRMKWRPQKQGHFKSLSIPRPLLEICYYLSPFHIGGNLWQRRPPLLFTSALYKAGTPCTVLPPTHHIGMLGLQEKARRRGSRYKNSGPSRRWQGSLKNVLRIGNTFNLWMMLSWTVKMHFLHSWLTTWESHPTYTVLRTPKTLTMVSETESDWVYVCNIFKVMGTKKLQLEGARFVHSGDFSPWTCHFKTKSTKDCKETGTHVHYLCIFLRMHTQTI